MMGFFDGWGWWWMAWMGLPMLLFGGGVIALIIWAVGRFTQRSTTDTSPSPLDIVKARYARGEINKNEFEQLKKDLG